MGVYFHSQQQALSAARLRFADGDELPDSLLPSALARSWERSRQAGLNPRQSACYPPLPRQVNPRAQPQDRRLLRCLGDEMERLWAAFGGRDWTIFCANPQGVIVAQRQHPAADAELLRPLQTGRRIQEVDVGTTAPACAMAEDAPALVRGNQHYLSQFDPVFCLSVPLHGLDGEVLGALDITGLGERDPELLLGYFRQASLAAGNRLLAELRHCHVLALQHDPRWLNTPMQGLLAVDAEGRVQAANRMARRLLQWPRQGRVPALSLAEVFAGSSAAQRRQLLQPGPARRIRLDAERAVFTQWLRSPLADARHRPLPRAAVAPAVPALREQAGQSVLQAVQAHGGNVSAAARQLGISRTTLYRRLAEAAPTG